ncbi:hypothetical protein MKX03_025185 [Papaver bracteatum]|nr:hypothetical protein MKX03_025185 [Papaver bracteatum]
MVRIGAATAVAIASADAAMELFKSHDQAFVNRHPIHALQQSIDDHATIWSPYGPIWRMNRRIYANIFSCTRLKNTLGKRRQFLDQIKQWISLEEKEGRSVEIRHLTSVAVANLLGNLFFSKDVMDLKSAAGSELYQLLGKLGVLVTTPNAADFFPCLRNLDPLNLANRTKKAFHAFRNIIEGFAEERRSTHGLRNNNDAKDYLDLLMDFEGNGKDEPRKLSNRDINWLITVSKFINLNNLMTFLFRLTLDYTLVIASDTK